MEREKEKEKERENKRERERAIEIEREKEKEERYTCRETCRERRGKWSSLLHAGEMIWERRNF